MALLGKSARYLSNYKDDEHNITSYERHKSSKLRAPHNYIYRDLEVVWARLECFPWWPAQCDFSIIDGDEGGSKTPRIPVRLFGEGPRTDWLDRDRVIPFSLEIESQLLKEFKVHSEDESQYNAYIEDAVLTQKKWVKDLEKERRQNKELDHEDFVSREHKVWSSFSLFLFISLFTI